MQTIFHLLVFGALLVSGAMPQPGDELIQAVKSRNLPLISRLIAEGADVNHVNDRGYTALVMAAEKGHTEIVTFLIESGASVNQRTFNSVTLFTPLLEATRRKQTEVVRILLRNGADVNQAVSGVTSTSAFHVAVYVTGDADGDSEIVSLMLENHADVNMVSSCDSTGSPLYGAATMANAPIVSKLIRAGADVNVMVNSHGKMRTALMRASANPSYNIEFTDLPRLYRRQIETISLLIRAGANINAVSTDGSTALLQAIMYEREDPVLGEDPVLVLIDHGANVNQRTAKGTPLMKAIEKGNSNHVRLLILAGAETSDIPANLFQEFIHPIMSLVTDHSSRITMAFIELKNTEQTGNMFKNAAFRELFTEWDSLRIDIISRIISYLVTLESEDLHVTYVLAPFLVNADLERLNKFSLVLQFLTAPFATITNASHGADQPELVRFIKATFRYAIVMGSFKDSYDSFFDPMYAVYSNLNAEMGALKQAMRVIPDVHIGTVLQFNHGEFGIYSKFAEYLKQILI